MTKKNVSYLVILSVAAALVWYVGAVIYGVAKPAVLFLDPAHHRRPGLGDHGAHMGWIAAGLLVLGCPSFPPRASPSTSTPRPSRSTD